MSNKETWFNNLSAAPDRFAGNIITSVDDTEDSIILLYDGELSETGVLYIPLVSLSAIPDIYKIDIKKSPESSMKLSKICIYGSVYVENSGLLNDGLFNENVIKRISISDSSEKFDIIEISGSFGDYNSMVNCINLFYDRLSASSSAEIHLHLDSRFMKDTGEMVTFAEALKSGYIPYNISDNITCQVFFEFRKLNLYDKPDEVEQFDENYTRYTNFND